MRIGLFDWDCAGEALDPKVVFRAPGCRGGGGSGPDVFVLPFALVSGVVSGIERERERGGGVAGGEGRVEGVLVPDEDPVLPTLLIEDPSAESELRIVDELDVDKVVAEGARARGMVSVFILEGEGELNPECVPSANDVAEGGGEATDGTE